MAISKHPLGSINCHKPHKKLKINSKIIHSGGPLVIADTVVGISAFVIAGPCARGAPDGWERVSSYYNWINSNAVN